ncbi:MAG TPA: hypothetical protein PLX06_03740 [Fimbriimonadaceae bacterium]|nr:hypothetical protein [Fimbriimonadaceae bacterium]
MKYEAELKAFAKRIARALAWRFAAVGLFLGMLVALVLAGADFLGWIWVDWRWLIAAPMVVAALGAMLGFLRKPKTSEIAASLDQRAGLRDRLTSGIELEAAGHPFAHEVHEDAVFALKSLDPKQLYPVRYLRWHSLALVAGLLAAGLFLLGNTPVFDSAERKREKEEMKKQAEDIAEVVKPVLREKDLSPMSKEYAKDLERFAQELERARMDRKVALMKANELANEGENLEKQLRDRMNSHMNDAQKSLEQMLAEQLQKDGVDATPEQIKRHLEDMMRGANPEYDQALQDLARQQQDTLARMNELKARMSELQRQLQKPGQSADDRRAIQEAMSDLQEEMRSMEQQLQDLKDEMAANDQEFRDQFGNENANSPAVDKEIQKLQREIAELMEKLKKDSLTPEQRKALEERLKELQKALKELKFPKELSEAMQKLMQDPKMKQIMQRMAELMKKARLADQEEGEGQPGEPPKITKEQIEELQRAIDEMAKNLQDADFRKQLLDDLKQMLDEMEELVIGQGMCMGFCLGMGILPGLPMPGGPMPGGAYNGSDRINKLSDPVKGEGKTKNARISGERNPNQGKETYVEVKGPASLGKPSQVPYLKVLPKYQQAAEEALRKQKVPKDQEKRVRDYFRAIGGQ